MEKMFLYKNVFEIMFLHKIFFEFLFQKVVMFSSENTFKKNLLFYKKLVCKKKLFSQKNWKILFAKKNCIYLPQFSWMEGTSIIGVANYKTVSGIFYFR
jgi:hypothetical protein